MQIHYSNWPRMIMTTHIMTTGESSLRLTLIYLAFVFQSRTVPYGTGASLCCMLKYCLCLICSLTDVCLIYASELQVDIHKVVKLLLQVDEK